jgi:hypothetical protein
VVSVQISNDGLPDELRLRGHPRRNGLFPELPGHLPPPKEDIIVEKFKLRDPADAAVVGDLQVEHQEGAIRLRRISDNSAA